MSTIFTKIINKEIPARILWEDNEFISFLPNGHFVNVGHILVVPKLEVDYIFDLPDKTYINLWKNVKKLSRELKILTSAKRVGIAVEGFSVPHVHVHLCPVNSVAELDPHRNEYWSEADRDIFVINYIKLLNSK